MKIKSIQYLILLEPQTFGYPKGCRKRFGKGIKTIFPKDCNEKLINLIEKLLSLDPVKRITARDAINHKYFDDFRGIINDT